jgi:acyl-coenzyme A synthetase/AMP-(fatty) acid ligase
MPAILLKLPVRADENFSGQIKFGFGAGSDPRHQRMFEQRFGFPLVEAWAMTETGGAGMIVAHREPRHVGQRCFGRPPERVEVRIVDEAGQDVEPGRDGELLVRCRGADPKQGFFSGYYKDPQSTQEAWRGGWLHTGDIVRQGPDGSLFFVDRRKNVIRRSGENIAAVEVEAVILELDGISNCAVTAVPDELRGDEVFAMVIADPGVEDIGLLSQQIFQHCMQSLAYFKAPGYLAFVDEIPLTASNKVSRQEVRKLALEYVNSSQALDLRARKKRPRVAP